MPISLWPCNVVLFGVIDFVSKHMANVQKRVVVARVHKHFNQEGDGGMQNTENEDITLFMNNQIPVYSHEGASSVGQLQRKALCPALGPGAAPNEGAGVMQVKV